MKNILVYAQIDDGAVSDVSLQCLATARCLAAGSGGRVSCLALGTDLEAAARHLVQCGADEVFTAEDAGLATFLTTPYKNTVKAFLAERSFDIVFFPATTEGDDLAPVLAAELDAPCVLDCDVCEAAGGNTVLKRLEYDRKVYTTYTPTGSGLLIVSLKDGVAAAPEADAGREGTVTAVAASGTDAGTSAVTRRDVVRKTVNLKDAQIIVGAGAGVGNEANFAAVRELAEKLGGELGATRAVVDAGWLPADHQIGQTGVTVRPDVYIACGISGAVQHKVGMSEAKTIVAVNLDKAAPIHKIAHYRVVGDLNTVVPKMIKALG
jgi:electron transfer flavoprotein alpha subunit